MTVGYRIEELIPVVRNWSETREDLRRHRFQKLLGVNTAEYTISESRDHS